MKVVQLVIPMAGTGDRFRRAGYTSPKPLLDIAGQPLIERLLQKFPKEWPCVFIVNEEQWRETPLGAVLTRLRPQCKIISIAPHKKGPVYTLQQGQSAIDNDLPTMVNYCDFSFSWDVKHFQTFLETERPEGAIFCYRGFHPHYLRNTMYAYCRDVAGQIQEVREKGCFTDDRTQEFASSGTYYFASGKLLKHCVETAIQQELHIHGEYYVSLIYNPLIQEGGRVLVYEIPFFLQWGTPEDMEDYVYWHRLFNVWKHWKRPAAAGAWRVVMPMAGLGSRFGDTTLPKPLIEVLQQPMYRAALAFLPPSASLPVFVIRRPLQEALESRGEKELITLDAPTQGQAESTLHGLKTVNGQDPVLVSACDHGILWDVPAWEALLEKKPDVVVLGQRGYPGVRRTPTAFSYFDMDEQGNITRVSVKKPLTEHPEREWLLIGTFYFSSASLLRELIRELQTKDIRVNNELYLDSVVALAMQKGLRVYGFDCMGYMNLGTPDALKEFSYWNRYFQVAS